MGLFCYNNFMNEWSAKRKRIVLTILIVFLIVLVGVPILFLSYRTPTCFDNKMNGGESGVDCGGSCELLCTPESLPLLTKGDPRVLEVAPGIYEVVVVLENPNVAAEVYRAGYTIRLYEAGNPAEIKLIEGETFIPKNSTFAIFLGPMELGDKVPNRATL